MRKLTDIPTEQHPYNLARHTLVSDELRDAIDGFRRAGGGLQGAYADIIDQLQTADRALSAAWGLIQLTERSEFDERADDGQA